MNRHPCIVRIGCILLCLVLCVTIVSCGRSKFPQLSWRELRAETDVLLNSVLESEWFHCWCSALSTPPSKHGPLEYPMEDFNGFMELLSRKDFESVLLQYFEAMTEVSYFGITHSAELLFLREETQAVLSSAAIDRIHTILEEKKQ